MFGVPGGPVRVRVAEALFVLVMGLRGAFQGGQEDLGFVGATSTAHALELAHDAGIVGTDEVLLHPDPFAGRDAWCRARVAETEPRLRAAADRLPTVLINHFPLVRQPTRVLRYPEFALWCGTELTADWHVRFRAAQVVYGLPQHAQVRACRGSWISVSIPEGSRSLAQL